METRKNEKENDRKQPRLSPQFLGNPLIIIIGI